MDARSRQSRVGYRLLAVKVGMASYFGHGDHDRPVNWPHTSVALYWPFIAFICRDSRRGMKKIRTATVLYVARWWYAKSYRRRHESMRDTRIKMSGMSTGSRRRRGDDDITGREMTR